MTQEEKQLLLKDLCARLPYGVICKSKSYRNILFNSSHISLIESEEIKPYLRPMSSMTEEEIKEYEHLIAFSGSSYGAANLVDWLNKKMFAYRNIDGKNMFELGLVLVAPEGMYK